jgi:acyl dehydratase
MRTARAAAGPRPGLGRALPPVEGGRVVAPVVVVVAEMPQRLPDEQVTAGGLARGQGRLVVPGREVALAVEVVGDPAPAHVGPPAAAAVRSLVAQLPGLVAEAAVEPM